MEITYTLLYHSKVVKDDIQKLNGKWKKQIKNAIEQKLSSAPLLYGAPLRKNLHGLYKLRVQDYRVIYRVDETTVQIIAIQHRREVYSNQVEERV
jgi:mRNA interferase RelE/StbE